MNNISDIRDCFGCGVCSIACPKHIINIHHNKDGFYEPYIIDIDRCNECGLCRDICAYLNNGLAQIEYKGKSYAAWSNDDKVRHNCSSGGIGFEIGKYLISKSYKACGVRYNVDDQRAEHYIAENIRDYIPSIGSKYIQSYTVDAFKCINKKERYLITGTPCQIDSFRRYIRKTRCEDNFVLLDFFCHGVPSMILWKRYLERVEQITGKITKVSWRNKFYGWHESFNMAIDGSINNLTSNRSDGNIFYKIFLSDICLGKACYAKCKYKYINSSADIRIGDLWGKKYTGNQEGISAVITFTKIGEEILHSLENCTLLEDKLSIVAEGQHKKQIKEPILRGMSIKFLKKNKISSVVRLAKFQVLIKIWKYRLSNPIAIYRKMFN